VCARSSHAGVAREGALRAPVAEDEEEVAAAEKNETEEENDDDEEEEEEEEEEEGDDACDERFNPCFPFLQCL
jgi:hypothetical protein